MRSLTRRVLLDTRYTLVGFPTTLIGFVLMIAGFAAGLGTAVVWIGVPLLAGTLMIARGFADAERGWLSDVLGRPPVRPRYKPVPEGAGRFRRLVNPLMSGQSWLDLLHGILNLPFAILGFVLTIVFWAIPIGGLTYPLYGIITSNIPGNTELPQLLGLGDGYLVNSAFYVMLGLVFALIMPFAVRGAALVRAGLGRALLTGVAELQERIDDLAEGRAAAVSAEANALRKLERDIHDGPQQRLVSLAMELSRAQRQLAKDPEAAQATIKSAITATRETLDELRALSRGIAPPILSDRGLAPALAALAGRCTVPVDLDVQTVERYQAAVENAIYFVCAETLTNVAKHSRATVCTVQLARVGNYLMLTIGDDGVGGAHVAKGHGLAGLADRLRAVDGELTVQSPDGGPTLIVAEVPCG
ncbi:two-component system sensor kinase [[Actinomadura] parvosata subsp. kistnae]|uniref:histidine kinase n=2 Tax=Nonomuraea TaxID=83681 RepID=A0A1U9ZS44_9ACTN|nr:MULTISPECIES: sensor histidine kinase [unclassified Nonomuraea]AQZ60775.1 histidine kinase [Nonomuraea sp. ATCC 55076]NJP95348.1 sensor histidine kinase [Nonomuraea sp. FMUSA5-5]SPL90598.1 two-component system sensor kinase [Actinomadura parvosata subsp. kistnae]